MVNVRSSNSRLFPPPDCVAETMTLVYRRGPKLSLQDRHNLPMVQYLGCIDMTI